MCCEAVGEADVLDEVGRVREADLAGPVIEHLEPRRARDEVDAIPAEVGVRVAVAVEQRERSWRARDGPFDDVAREQHATAPASVGSPASMSRRRISGPRTSIPTSASTRFASSTIRSMSSAVTASRGRGRLIA